MCSHRAMTSLGSKKCGETARTTRALWCMDTGSLGRTEQKGKKDELYFELSFM